ncbi:hypothetical protein N7466_008489 [Penicillium verhagenii]|uniref:uncharacterized protein n=1 Tax=Penicillium verhagenii TaxID=1562060 RepID=UPI00254539EE|nr:uncharacterized protein N7466_008489 [Penicillium verhagenii]KAJ5924302.1 hypothetical protein N7466_008489 [Penicillium verhagenii]
MSINMNSRHWLPRWLLLTGSLIMGVISQDVVIVTVETTVKATSTVYDAPTVPSPASYTSLPDFKETVLQASNEYRGAHEAVDIVWNETLVEYARKWAETCIWKHSDGPYGENLAFGYANATAAVEAWGDEGELYNFEKPTGFTEATGHFTQLVWKATEEVGCAAVNCGYTEDMSKVRRDGEKLASRTAADGSSRAQGWYVVCEYTPAGNVVGDHDVYFKKNVWPSYSKTGSNSSSSASATETASGSVSTATSRPNKGATTMQNSVESTVCMMFLALGVVGVGMSLYT